MEANPADKLLTLFMLQDPEPVPLSRMPPRRDEPRPDPIPRTSDSQNRVKRLLDKALKDFHLPGTTMGIKPCTVRSAWSFS